jgi:RNA polymerase sigma factor (sigma-70 family)
MAKPDFKSMSDDDAKSFIANHIKKRFTKNGPIIGKLPRDQREDAISEVFIDLWNNRFNYDPLKADFTTYAYNRGRGVVKSMLQNYIKISRVRDRISSQKRKPFYESESNIEAVESFNILVSILTKEEFEILKMRFIDSIDVVDISKKLNLNPQKIYSMIREAKMKCIENKWNINI